MLPTLHDVDDAGLIDAIRHSDDAALGEVYNRHARAVYGLARRVLNDDSHAEEVVQEIFLRLWNEPDRFDAGRGSLRTFLYRETHSRSIERIRSEESRRTRETREDRERTPVAIDIEREVWEMIRGEQVKDALSTLTEGERTAIDLAYFGGRTYREVAVMLDLPEGTVKSRMRAGLSKLADELERLGIGARDDR